MSAQHPKNFVCPLTKDLMIDPVMDSEGNSYEREAIMRWLSLVPTSPITHMPLTENDLCDNNALRKMITTYLTGLMKQIGLKPAQAQAQAQAYPMAPGANVMVSQANIFQPKIDQQNPVVAMADDEKDDENITIEVISNAVFEHCITITNIDKPIRVPTKVICVVDTSGSMETEVKNGDEDTGLTRLAIVQHALRTVINVLKAGDYFSLYSFSDEGKLIIDSCEMTQNGKLVCMNNVEKLCSSNCTNLWDGMRMGIESAKSDLKNKKVHNTSVLVFTDGEPTANYAPRSGYDQALKTLVGNNMSYSVSTFGFANQLDSSLLSNLSTIGNGMFSFIPDGSFVGTIIINHMCNLLTNYAQNAKILVTTKEGIETHQLNDLCYGQSRTIILKTKSAITNVKLMCNRTDGSEADQSCNVHMTEIDQHNIEKYQSENIRTMFINTLVNGMNAMKTNGVYNRRVLDSILSTFSDRIDESLTLYPSIYLENFKKDFVSEITTAFNSKYYDTWGKHYLLSVIDAHKNQKCNNFKDNAVQLYGCALFKNLQTEMNKIFETIEPPKTKPKVVQDVYGNISYVYKPVNMSSMNNSDGPCFSGDSVTIVQGKGKTFIQDIKQDDLVQSMHGYSKVKYILKTLVSQPKLVKMTDELMITRWHPVYVNNKWQFPNDITEYYVAECDAVFSFVLENEHNMIIGEIPCITLGHGIQNNSILNHPYYGTDLVVNDLEQLADENGLVTITLECIKRDAYGFVCKISL
jgi:hypothetical protein